MMAGGTVLFAAGGWAVDRLLGTLPVLTIIGALAGVGLSSLSVWRRLNPTDDETSERERSRNRRTRQEDH
jgi:F0F1-type ATP synthase assembly protein I